MCVIGVMVALAWAGCSRNTITGSSWEGELTQKDYLFAAFRLVGNETLTWDKATIVTTTGKIGDTVTVTFFAFPLGPHQRRGEELARVRFAGDRVQLEPASLLLKPTPPDQDRKLLQVALVGLSSIAAKRDGEFVEEFSFSVSKPSSSAGVDDYSVLLTPAPYMPGHYTLGSVVVRSGKLTYVPSPVGSQ